jgi:hypothetical protein
MVLLWWQRLMKNSRGSRKISSWVTVQAIHAIGMANKNNQAICVDIGIMQLQHANY